MASLPVLYLPYSHYGTIRQHGAPLCTFGSVDAGFCFPDRSGFVLGQLSRSSLCTSALLLQFQSIRLRISLWKEILHPSTIMLCYRPQSHHYSTPAFPTTYTPRPYSRKIVSSDLGFLWDKLRRRGGSCKRGLSRCRLLPTDGCR